MGKISRPVILKDNHSVNIRQIPTQLLRQAFTGGIYSSWTLGENCDTVRSHFSGVG